MTKKTKLKWNETIERDFAKVESRVVELAEQIFGEAPTWRVDLVQNPGQNLGEFHERFILARTYSYRVTALVGEVQSLRQGASRVIAVLQKRYGDRVRAAFRRDEIRTARSDELRKRMVEAEAAEEKGALELFEPLAEQLEQLYWFLQHCHRELGETRMDLGSQLTVIRHQIVTGELKTKIPLSTVERVLSSARRGDAIGEPRGPIRAERAKPKKKKFKGGKRRRRETVVAGRHLL